jgi:amino acid adenylation domain-containing protein
MTAVSQDRSVTIPASPGQERVWILDRFYSTSIRHNVSCCVWLEGSISIDALTRALHAVVQRHEMLRTTFHLSNEGVVQRVHASLPPTVKVSGDPALTKDETTIAQLREEESNYRFDLSVGPLVRMVVLDGKDGPFITLTLHHIVCDAASIRILIEEIREFYVADREGRVPALPPTVTQYSTYVANLGEYLEAGGLQASLAYWRTKFATAPCVMRLPTDLERPTMQSMRGIAHDFALSGRVAEGLETAGARFRATPFMVLAAGFAILLHRLTQSRDVVFATHVDGRQVQPFERTVGFFINTILLRSQLEKNATFRTVVEALRQEILNALDHQRVPFQTVVNELRPPRDLSRMPLAQAAIVFDNAPLAYKNEGSCGIERLRIDTQTSEFDVSLNIVRDESEFHGRFTCAADLFVPATIAGMSERFVLELERRLAAPDEPIWENPTWPAARRRRRRNSGRGATSVLGAVEATCEVLADAPAVIRGHESLSYRQLDARANAIGARLRGRGVVAGARVGLHMSRGPNLIAAILGILRSGAAYVPLEAGQPYERLMMLIKKAGVVALVTDSTSWPDQRVGCTTLRLGHSDVVERDDDVFESPPVAISGHEADVAYLMHTSGSSGFPKAVAVTHKNIASVFRAMDVVLESGVDSPRAKTWLAVTTPSFDISVIELLWTISRGFTVMLQPWAEATEALGERAPGTSWRALPQVGEVATTVALLARRDVTHLQCTPTFASLLVDAREGLDRLAALDHFLVGGEVLPPELARRLSLLEGVRVHNMYGPTETTIWASEYELRDVDAVLRRSVPIGKPLTSSRIYVLDDLGNPVVQGSAGELAIGGPCVTLGYWGEPSRTAAQFVPDPFGQPGSRMYKTGDRGRFTDDWNLEFLGRRDNQVKLRGVRIELGEIETWLERDTSVDRAIVELEEHANGDAPGSQVPRLVAYIKSKESVGSSDSSWERRLRNALRESLPSRLIPAEFVAVPAFPVNERGKVDRSALKALRPSDASFTHGLSQTPTEAMIAIEWRKVFCVGHIARDANFFESGGDSLMLLELHNRLVETFDIALPLAALFNHATIADSARYLDELIGRP